MGVKCLAQEHNTMSPARARTRSARSGVERTNHEATTPGGSNNNNDNDNDNNDNDNNNNDCLFTIQLRSEKEMEVIPF